MTPGFVRGHPMRSFHVHTHTHSASRTIWTRDNIDPVLELSVNYPAYGQNRNDKTAEPTRFRRHRQHEEIPRSIIIFHITSV